MEAKRSAMGVPRVDTQHEPCQPFSGRSSERFFFSSFVLALRSLLPKPVEAPGVHSTPLGYSRTQPPISQFPAGSSFVLRNRRVIPDPRLSKGLCRHLRLVSEAPRDQ